MWCVDLKIGSEIGPVHKTLSYNNHGFHGVPTKNANESTRGSVNQKDYEDPTVETSGLLNGR
jgi:hypothetical protein